MAESPDTTRQTPRSRPPRRRKGWSVQLSCSGMLLLIFLNVLFLLAVGWPVWQMRQRTSDLPATDDASSTNSPVVSDTATPSLEPSLSPTISPEPTTSIPGTPRPPSTISLKNGLIILSLQEGAHSHLFAYQPQQLPFTRLTSGDWNDITPAISPDGQYVAFASNRNGYYDLYLLELLTGEITRLTDTLEYDAAPSWSPDGQWLIYESYFNGNLDLMILPADGLQAPIPLTDHPAADYSPAWSPQGRQIAFVSNRSGVTEIWMADLDLPGEERFVNLSREPLAVHAHPAWSPDGSKLAWSSVRDGVRQVMVLSMDADANNGVLANQAQSIGSGDWPVFSADNQTVMVGLFTPNQHYLTAFPVDQPGLAMPPVSLPGDLMGLTWADADFPWPLPETYIQAIAVTPTPLYQVVETPSGDTPGGRAFLVELPSDVEAPYPYLHDRVDEAFNALRPALANLIGWDYLAGLENAYVPLTSALEPGMQDDWLYTGRAFALNPLPINAGWVSVVREDFGAQTYWRVFVRSRYQDGSAGMPIHDLPWLFDARLSGDPTAFEAGGRQAQKVPAGYWIDFTDLAAAYGWERLPAVIAWQKALPLSRYNVFAQTEGLDWMTGMLQIYPPDGLATPTAVIPPTRTLTPTPRWYQSPTPTLTATPRPTNTPLTPTATPTPTKATNTPRVTRTSTATKTPTRTSTPTP